MEKDIGKIPKNEMSDIVIRIDDFGGRPGLTIREFVTGERYTGFTKSGVKIPAAEFKKFKEMINSINEDDLKQEPGSEQENEQKTLTENSEETEEIPDY
jgi:hypothetical protein